MEWWQKSVVVPVKRAWIAVVTAHLRRKKCVKLTIIHTTTRNVSFFPVCECTLLFIHACLFVVLTNCVLGSSMMHLHTVSDHDTAPIDFLSSRIEANCNVKGHLHY
jgi:hypothetical protein